MTKERQRNQIDKAIEESIRQHGEKVTFDALDDASFISKSARELADSINRGDPKLARCDWEEKTLGFNLEFIGLVFRQINADNMIDVISARISTQYYRMVRNREIEDFLNSDNYDDSEPEASLNAYAFDAHQRLEAIRIEEVAQRKLEQQLKIVNEQSHKLSHNVKPRFYADGEPDVDDIYSEIADEMAPYIQEIESLKSMLADRDAEIDRLNNELRANEERMDSLPAMPTAALFKAAAQLINKEEGKTVAESIINVSQLAAAFEAVTGFNAERARPAMGTNEKSTGKNVITQAHKQKAAEAVRDVMPRLAEAVLKL